MKKIILLLLSLVVIFVWLAFFTEKESAPVVTDSDSPAVTRPVDVSTLKSLQPDTPTEIIPVGKYPPDHPEDSPSHTPSESEDDSEIPETNIENDKGPESLIVELPVAEIPELLKKSEELTEISGLGYFVPGCYLGEFYPYPGKPDRFEVELHYTARGGTFDQPARKWKIYGNSYLVIKKLGAIFRDYGPDKFRKPPPLKKGTYGFLVVDPEKAIYQFVGEKGKVHMTYFEKNEESWVKLADARLTLSSGPECNSHGYPMLPGPKKEDAD